MKTITRSNLKGRSATELRVLAGIFNSIMVAAHPLSAEWRAAADAVTAIQAERDLRLSEPFKCAV
jgi:hypothetical protein